MLSGILHPLTGTKLMH